VAGHPFGVVGQLAHVPQDFLGSVPFTHLGQPELAPADGCELSPQIPFPLLRRPNALEDEVQKLRLDFTSVHEELRRDHDPLLRKLGREPHGSRCLAANVGVVGPVRHEAEQTAARIPVRPRARIPARACIAARVREHRRNQRDVREVRPAPIRVVKNRDVTGAHLQFTHTARDRQRHRSEVNGDVGGQSGHLGTGVEQRAGVIAPLLDVGRESGAPKHRAHLLGDRRQKVPIHLETHWIHAAGDRSHGAHGEPPSLAVRPTSMRRLP